MVNAASYLGKLGPHFTEAIATVHRLVTAGYKGDRCVNPALIAHDRMHFSGAPAETALLALTSLTILGTPLGFVGISPGSEELLLANGEGKWVPAFHAGKGFV